MHHEVKPISPITFTFSLPEARVEHVRAGKPPPPPPTRRARRILNGLLKIATGALAKAAADAFFEWIKGASGLFRSLRRVS